MIVSKYNLRPGILILLCLFNCALLLHLGNANWFHYKTTSLVAFMVGLQFLNYKSWWPTAASIVVCLFVFITKVPRLANHFNLEIIIGAIILGFLLYRYLGFKNRITTATLTLTIRYLLIAIYFIAGFHKLNSGFFSTSGSCASYINLIMFGQDAAMPLWLTRIFQVTTIVTEMVLPFGLLHHKLRKPTVCCLVLFHAYLSLCGFANFSAFAAFLLFGSVVNFSDPDYSAVTKKLKIYILCSLAAAITGFFYSYFPNHKDIPKLLRGIIFSIGFILLFKGVVPKIIITPQTHRFSIVPALAVVAITLWGMQGYFGLSTARSFNMYSNLITEKSRNNHYLINTNKTKIWDFEEDLVTVVRLPKGAYLENFTPHDLYNVPLIEFKRNAKRWVAKNPDASCTIIYKNKLIDIPNLKNSEFSKTKWWYRLLFYRMVPKEGTNPCDW